MKNTWKWILGIVIVLVVIAALVSVPLIIRGVMASRAAAGSLPQARGLNFGPMMPGNQGRSDVAPGGREFQNPRGPRFDGGRGPMMGWGHGFNRGFPGFGFGFMFIGGLLRLIPLALLGLLLYGVYRLGKNAGMRARLAPAQPAPVQPQPVQPTQVASAKNNEPPAA